MKWATLRSRSLVSLTDDDRAFIELYNAYFSRIYNYVHYQVNDFHETDDLTNQIFLKLCSK